MSVPIAIFVFLFGIVFGSFYNVVIYRLPLGIPISKGRSMCTSCGHTLGAIDLVPIFSWLFLRGRCRYCGEKISPRYLIIELITGCLFVLAYLTQGYSLGLILFAAFWSMLLIVTMMDFDGMVISESVLLVFTAICTVCLLLLKRPVVNHLLGGAVGFGVYWVIYLLAKAFYKREGFGFGDVELMASIGLVLGLRGSIEALWLSFYIAVLGIILMKILGKAVGRGIEMPFGPYMCAAAFAVSLFEQPIYDFYSRVILGR
ncbi:MAG: prepilin peptidase [Clostridiales bacterium]|jgi:leader peptidase (prepilin peptidase)/N-methyltransferase|nr:prepilin peptidase [Clostridiales bacterium]